jgi:hypothetical protein
LNWQIVDKTREELAADLIAERAAMIVSPYQGKAALYEAGLLDQVEAIIANPATDGLTRLAWNNAGEWRRMSPMIATLSGALSLTDTQVDDLFRAAQQITA